MLRRFLVLAIIGWLAGFAFGGSPAQAQAPEGVVQIVPSITPPVPVDDAFTVFVVLEDLQHVGRVGYDDNRDGEDDRFIESVGLGAFEVRVTYDPAVLSTLSAVAGPALASANRTFQCLPADIDEPGTVALACLSVGSEPPGPQGTLTLAELAFQPVGAGSTALMLNATLSGPLGDDNVPVDVRSGAVRVAGNTARPTSTGGGNTPGGTGQQPPGARTATAAAVAAFQTQTSSGTPLPGQGTPESVRNSPDTGTAGENSSPGQDDEISTRGGDDGGGFPMWPAVTVAALMGGVGLGLGAVLWRRRYIGS
jgi:hypothetical protein